jgi:hypothetical protein
MDSVRSGPFGQIFRPDNFIFGQVRSTLGAHCSSTADLRVSRTVMCPRSVAHREQCSIMTSLCPTDRSGQQLGQGSLHRRCRAHRLGAGCCAEGGRELRLPTRCAIDLWNTQILGARSRILGPSGRNTFSI